MAAIQRVLAPPQNKSGTVLLLLASCVTASFSSFGSASPCSFAGLYRIHSAARVKRKPRPTTPRSRRANWRSARSTIRRRRTSRGAGTFRVRYAASARVIGGGRGPVRPVSSSSAQPDDHRNGLSLLRWRCTSIQSKSRSSSNKLYWIFVIYVF